jgi:hypothetical protein
MHANSCVHITCIRFTVIIEFGMENWNRIFVWQPAWRGNVSERDVALAVMMGCLTHNGKYVWYRDGDKPGIKQSAYCMYFESRWLS